jgi:hypothetical protein
MPLHCSLHAAVLFPTLNIEMELVYALRGNEVDLSTFVLIYKCVLVILSTVFHYKIFLYVNTTENLHV